jgi:hypothetical protein
MWERKSLCVRVRVYSWIIFGIVGCAGAYLSTVLSLYPGTWGVWNMGHTCTHQCMHKHTHTSTHKHTHKRRRIHTCKNTHTHICIHTHTRSHTHKYIYTHMRTHTHSPEQQWTSLHSRKWTHILIITYNITHKHTHIHTHLQGQQWTCWSLSYSLWLETIPAVSPDSFD